MILNAASLWLGQVGLEWVDAMAAGDTTPPRSTPQARRTVSASSAGSPSQRAGDAPLVSAIREAGAHSDSLFAGPDLTLRLLGLWESTLWTTMADS